MLTLRLTLTSLICISTMPRVICDCNSRDSSLCYPIARAVVLSTMQFRCRGRADDPMRNFGRAPSRARVSKVRKFDLPELTFAPFARARRSRIRSRGITRRRTILELPFYAENGERSSRDSIDRENQLRRLARRLSASFAIPRAASSRSRRR